MAREINRWTGASVGPWDLPYLDESTLDLFKGLRFDLTALQAADREVEAFKDKIRKQIRPNG